MKQNTDADEAQTQTVATFDNSKTGETITVTGKIVDRDKRHDAEWCNERITVENGEGMEFTFYMADNYDMRRVRVNGTTVGNWTAFMA